MKSRVLLIFAMAFAIGANAQNSTKCNKNNDCCKNDKNIFNHLAVGLNVGTTGIGFDVAMPICNYVQVRAGVDFMPNIKVSTDFGIDAPNVEGYNIPQSIEAEGKVGFTNGKLLFDVYPFRSSSFHVTAGAYFGSSKIVKAYNKEYGVLGDLAKYNNDVEAGLYPGAEKIGVELGDYLLEPDDDGNVQASIKTASFKPYLGIGFGRAVPKKRVGFMFDLGVQFWGTPKVYCFDKRLTDEDTNGGDGGIIKTISKIKVYPTMNFRICGRIL
ncbi:hypothetical protein [Xylanibacter caecicola]|uniref:hypothetical protein n=1 Tax=Xylanibacter caecicola TaxID=2736294 RepID=UPI00258B63CC|nr:hypothetical protein [Xylanibacter caecicola]